MQFHGFGPGVFAWFEGLERDNSRDYFAATRDRYEAGVRGGLVALLDELSAAFDGEAKVFRQHRDLRFSADRSPYKTRTYGVLGGRYAELSARGLYAGLGYPGLAADQLERYRGAVDDEATGRDLAARVQAAEAAGLELAGAELRTAPRGMPRDHPRIGLLRRRALIAGRRLAPDGAAGIAREAALAHVAGTWRAAAPLVGWLDEHVGPSELPPDARGRFRGGRR